MYFYFSNELCFVSILVSLSPYFGKVFQKLLWQVLFHKNNTKLLSFSIHEGTGMTLTHWCNA